MSYIQIIQLVAALIIILLIVALMIRRKSSANMSLFWLAIALLALIQAVFPRLLDTLCLLIGVEYPPTLVLVTAVIFLLVITFYLSCELSVSQNKLRELTMHISLLNDEMALVKKNQAERD